jgi:triacylglycerol esterase/lipase EstA (alpha/beta hydrolase family)
MVARTLQIILISVLGLSAIGLWWQWCQSALLALAWLSAGLLLYVVLIALSFLKARHFNRSDPAQQATMADWVGAWWAEVLAMSRVFFWQQAFAANQFPDQVKVAVGQPGRRGMVLVHGYLCNRGIWNPWLQRLTQDKRAFAAVSLEPVFTSIDDYAAQVEQAVKYVTAATGMAPLVVCHSMGGLAARAWLRSGAGNDARVRHIVTIGTPHHGTKVVGRSGATPNAQQMVLNSDWLQQLALQEPPSRYANFTCFYSNCDSVVFPASTATLTGADNRLVAGAPHLAMAFNSAVMDTTFAKL